MQHAHNGPLSGMSVARRKLEISQTAKYAKNMRHNPRFITIDATSKEKTSDQRIGARSRMQQFQM
jgi:hypothetical protein